MQSSDCLRVSQSAAGFVDFRSRQGLVRVSGSVPKGYAANLTHLMIGLDTNVLACYYVEGAADVGAER